MSNFFSRLAGVCLLSSTMLPLTSWAQCNLLPNGDFEQQNASGGTVNWTGLVNANIDHYAGSAVGTPIVTDAGTFTP